MEISFAPDIKLWRVWLYRSFNPLALYDIGFLAAAVIFTVFFLVILLSCTLANNR